MNKYCFVWNLYLNTGLYLYLYLKVLDNNVAFFRVWLSFDFERYSLKTAAVKVSLSPTEPNGSVGETKFRTALSGLCLCL